MRIRFRGVRGSVPVPGPTTARVGGNTACVTLELEAGVVVLDAGTGIRSLGADVDDERDVFLLFSHRHADHTQGLPFFAPMIDAGRRVFILDLESDAGSWSALELFDGLQNPLRTTDLASTVVRVAQDSIGWLGARGIEVRRMALRHPGGCVGYRLREGERSYVHMTDNELPSGVGDPFFDACVEFARDADVLCHDAQYVEVEMEAYRGRGHSSVERSCDLAKAAGVRRLVLFHHDPDRDDAAVDALETVAHERLRGSGIICEAARETLSIEL